jgi:peroxiredoxin Q/BCP
MVVLAGVCAVGAGCPMPARQAPVAPPPPEDTSTILGEGVSLPELSAASAEGKPVSLRSFRGKTLVLYFYPMDFAAGATALADGFRDDYPRYRKLGVAVVGISTDEPDVHRRFAERYKLPYPLLSDPGGAIARAFGIPLQAGTARHVTFVVDRQGVIRKVWRTVHPWGHSAEVLAALRTMGK